MSRQINQVKFGHTQVTSQPWSLRQNHVNFDQQQNTEEQVSHEQQTNNRVDSQTKD